MATKEERNLEQRRERHLEEEVKEAQEHYLGHIASLVEAKEVQ